MSSSKLPTVSSPQTNKENYNENVKADQDYTAEAESSGVSSHLHIKPAHSSGRLDKELVLRRIRQQKRVNKMGSALQSKFKTDKKFTLKWVDDAFAAP